MPHKPLVTTGSDEWKQYVGKLLPAMLVMLAITLSFVRGFSWIPLWFWAVAIVALFIWAVSRVFRT